MKVQIGLGQKKIKHSGFKVKKKKTYYCNITEVCIREMKLQNKCEK